jgi:2-methylcitrate dehydratase
MIASSGGAPIADVVQFDRTTTAIAEYAVGLDRTLISVSARQTMTRRLIEAIGCALGAFEAKPCVSARGLAASSTSNPGASVFGLDSRSTPELAVFANASMVRYLDFNDTYHTEGGGHPSDMMPAILAAAEVNDASGDDVLTAMHVAYEVFAALADAVPMRDKGWDYGGFLGIATAAGVGRVMGLDAAGVANAVSIAVTPNMPLFVTRTGELSNWKGCASAYASMAGLFAARVTAAGISGPPMPFEGTFGVWDQITGPFEIASLGSPVDGRSAVERTSCKLHPSDFETQIPAQVFIELHSEGIAPDDIAAIDIATYYVAWDLIGGGQGDHDEKWDPKRRETADHSLPYLIAVALSDGEVTKSSFTPERVADPALRPLMQRISVVEDPEITRTWTTHPAYEFDIRLTNGDRRRIRVDHPRGHFRDPLTDDEVVAKFLANSRTVMTVSSAQELLDMLWLVDGVPSINDIMRHLRSVGSDT